MPEITRLDGIDEPVTVRIANPTSDLEYLKLIADNDFDFHIDIDSVLLTEREYIGKVKMKCKRLQNGCLSDK